jgi:hypothetical protein
MPKSLMVGNSSLTACGEARPAPVFAIKRSDHRQTWRLEATEAKQRKAFTPKQLSV